MAEPVIDLDFRPRSLVPWLRGGQRQISLGVPGGDEGGYVITCPLPRVPRARRARRCPNGRYYLATFAMEPSDTVYPCRGFLLARPVKGRRFEIEDSRNTRKGVESFGRAVVPRIPSMREMVAVIDGALNLGGEEFGPALSTWQETLRGRYRKYPGEWSFWVRSLNYPQLEAWYRRQWEELDLKA
mgnify:FL=1